MSMELSKSLPLLQGTITLQSALEDDDNTLLKLLYPDKRIDFFVLLYEHRDEIAALVSYHLGLPPAASCRVGEVKEWISGSFNVCIPVYVNSWTHCRKKRVLIRFPLPYKVGESRYPGNADEKLRCEAAAFIWIQQNCDSVPIPYLWGFGFPNGQIFRKPENVPFYTRMWWRLRQAILWLFKHPLPCSYVCEKHPFSPNLGYLIMDYIEEPDGKMLSESWEEHRHNQTRTANLFQDLSRIMLSLARKPLPQIGSLTIDDQGILSLTNRPLTLRLHHLENEGIPTHIGRNLTYETVDTYLLDLLAYHNNRLRNQPNSIRDEYDGRAQIAALTAMRALYPHFFDRKLRHGPFIFTLTDLSQNNILVDDNWNIKCLVDLEWSCSLPAEKLHPPSWLTSRGVDELEEGEHLEAYCHVREEFMGIFEKEEKKLAPKFGNPTYCTNIMRRGWETGSFWYLQALDNPRGLYNIFLQHIQPRFERPSDGGALFDQAVSPYWAPDIAQFITAKVKEKGEYDEQLRSTFQAG